MKLNTERRLWWGHSWGNARFWGVYLFGLYVGFWNAEKGSAGFAVALVPVGRIVSDE